MGRPHGIYGEVSVRPEPGFEPAFDLSASFRVSRPDFPILVVRTVRPATKGLIVAFAGITSRESAALLTGCELYTDQPPVATAASAGGPADRLVGLEVRQAGVAVGVVAQVITGRQDRLVVSCYSGASAEVPLVEALIPEIHPEEGWLAVVPFAGLLDGPAGGA